MDAVGGLKAAMGRAAMALVLDPAYADVLHKECGLIIDVATLNRDHTILMTCVMCPFTITLIEVRSRAANPADAINTIFMTHRQASLNAAHECPFVVAKETAAAEQAAAAAAAVAAATTQQHQTTPGESSQQRRRHHHHHPGGPVPAAAAAAAGVAAASPLPTTPAAAGGVSLDDHTRRRFSFQHIPDDVYAYLKDFDVVNTTNNNKVRV